MGETDMDGVASSHRSARNCSDPAQDAVAPQPSSPSAPVEDEEKVCREILIGEYRKAGDKISVFYLEQGDTQPDDKNALAAMREYARRLRAPVGVTVGEPALTRLEVEGWQPIETAPNDGTEILVCVQYYLPDGELETAIWVDSTSPEYPWVIWEMRADLPPCLPTHWMPLPAPPKRSELASVSGSPPSPKQTSELEEAEAIGCGGLK